MLGCFAESTLSPSLVILSVAKDLSILLRVNSAKNLHLAGRGGGMQILLRQLAAQNDTFHFLP